MTENLSVLLRDSAERFKDKTALFFEDKKISYKELYIMSIKLAQGLKNLGVAKNDRIAIFLQNTPEFIISYFAIFRIGAISVPVNSMFKEEELGFILKDSGAKIIISSTAFLPIVHLAKVKSSSFIEHAVFIDGLVPDTFNFYEMIDRSPFKEEKDLVLPDDVASILYTSGTTGNPKGAMLTHKNFISNIKSCISGIKASEDDNFICLLPMFHSFAFTVCIVLPLSVGAEITIVSHIRPIRKVIRNVIKKRVTVFVGIPSLFNILAHMQIPNIFTSRILKLIDPLRLAISGAAALPAEVLKAFENKFKVPLLEGYGLTEASPVVSLNPMHGKRKPWTVGLAIKGVVVKVIDEAGRDLPCGITGEILVKGDNIMKGYLNNPEATKETIKDGWLYTGDIGNIDEEGYIHIVDRKKDMINVRGLNVYPAEIEKLLHQHPKVREAAVIGVTDKFKGEVPKAFIIPKENQKITATEIKNYLKEHMAQYKLPKLVEFTDVFPRTATGKVLKRALK